MDKKNLTWNFNYEYQGKQHSRTKCVIYKVENTISGKVYIGQTRRMLWQRWQDYKYNLLTPVSSQRTNGTNVKLRRSVQKHFKQHGNIDFLKFSIVEVVEIDSDMSLQSKQKLLNAQEQSHIKAFRKTHGRHKVCNVLDGGNQYVFTNEDRASISKAKKRFYKTEEGLALKEKLSKIHAGKTMSEECKKKLSESHKGLFVGNKHPLYGVTGTNSATYGMVHTEKSKKLMSENRKGKNSGLSNHNTKIFDLTKNPLVSPDGVVVNQIVCLTSFCKVHHLHRGRFRQLLKSEISNYKGWHLVRSLMNCCSLGVMKRREMTVTPYGFSKYK